MIPDYNTGEYPYYNQENYNRRRTEVIADSDDLRFFEEVDPVSQTVPGEALSLKEIFERANNGIAPKIVKAEYMDQENLDILNDRAIDLVDLQEQRDALTALEADINEEIARVEAEQAHVPVPGDETPAEPEPEEPTP